MQKYKKFVSWLTVFLVLVSFTGAAQAAPTKDAPGLLTSFAMPASESGGSSLKIVDTILNFLFDRVLEPLLNIVKSDNNVSSGGSKSSAVKKPGLTLPKKTDAAAAVVNSDSLRGKVIVVDPGHGGSNPGAVANGVEETDVNLAVSLKLRDLLLQNGAKVIMTRETDRKVAPESTNLSQELAARVKIAHENDADIFVSIHANYNSQKAVKGAMTFYYNAHSYDLARKIQNGLIGETKAIDKGVEIGNFHVIRNTSMPSVLVETGFLSNAGEADILCDDKYRAKMAQGIYNGIAQYFDK